jgi:ligand-binding sensor domain-containing protein
LQNLIILAGLYEEVGGELAIVQDKLGNMWFGTSLGDIVKFDGINWITYHPFTNYFTKVTSAAVDDNNILWFTSYQEVAKYDGNSWTLYDPL